MVRGALMLAALCVAMLALAAPGPAASASYILQAEMYGDQQVPPVETLAWGFVRFFFSEDRLSAEFTVDVKGLSGNLVTGADIHRGPPGSNGPVVHHLADGGFIVTSGRLRLTPEDLDELVAGLWYASLKTTLHPQGELRGQIVPAADFRPAARAALAAPQEPARVPGPASQITPPNTGDGGLMPGRKRW